MWWVTWTFLISVPALYGYAFDASIIGSSWGVGKWDNREREIFSRRIMRNKKSSLEDEVWMMDFSNTLHTFLVVLGGTLRICNALPRKLPLNNCKKENLIDFYVESEWWYWHSRVDFMSCCLLRNRTEWQAAWCCWRQGSSSPQALWILTCLLLKSLEGWGWAWELGIITGGCSKLGSAPLPIAPSWVSRTS